MCFVKNCAKPANYAFEWSVMPRRVVARDPKHSQTEDRCYCFGQVEPGVLTVRFTYRGSKIRIIGAGYWTRGKKVCEAHRKIHK